MHQEDKEVRGLSQVAKYTLTAVGLGIFTAIEVLVLYPPISAANDTLKIALLAFLGVLKFIVVVALFMHLWQDNPIFTGIFTLGMILGGGTLVSFLFLFSYYPKMDNAVKHPPLEQIHQMRMKERTQGSHSDEHARLMLKEPGCVAFTVG